MMCRSILVSLFSLLASGFMDGAEERPEGRPPSLLPPQATRARVVVVEDPAATAAFLPGRAAIRRMVDRGLAQLTTKPTAAEAWRSLVATQDVIGLKVLASPSTRGGTQPAVAEALIESLLAAGHPAGNIILWDRQLSTLEATGFAEVAGRCGVRLEGAQDSGYDTNHFYDSAFIGQPIWGDVEFGLRGAGVGRRSYVSKLVTREVTKIISLSPLLNHNHAGVSGSLFNVSLGSVDNTLRFTSAPSQLALAVPEIYALSEVGDRVILNVTDACLAQYYGEERSLLHYTAVLNQLRFSTDPVALDVLSVRELERQRELADVPPVKTDFQLYQNASLVQIGISDVTQILVEWVK